MKLHRKWIVGAILGLLLVFSIFSCNKIKTKAVEISISPITSLDDIPIGAKIVFDTHLTSFPYGASYNWKINGSDTDYQASNIIMTTSSGNIFNLRWRENEMIYNSSSVIYNGSSWVSGWNVMTITSNIYFWENSTTQDNASSDFIDWFNDNAIVYVEQTIPQVSITLDANGGYWETGSGDEYNSLTISCDQGNVSGGITATMVGNDLINYGYTLVGWNTSSSATTGLSTAQLNAITSTTILYAIWRSADDVLIQFDANTTGYTGSPPPSVYYPKNSYYNLPNNPGNMEKTHYNFLGWATSPNASYNDIVSVYYITDATTFYGVWEIEKKTLTLNLNGGSISGSTSRQYDYGSVVDLATLGTPIKVGFIFLGWGLTADATEYVSTITMTTNKNIYAIWGTSSADLATITYYSNGATGGYVPSPVMVVKGTAYNVEGNIGNLTRTGYTFIGWGLTTDAITPQTTIYPSVDLNLYAIWVQLSYSDVNIYLNNVLIANLRVYNGDLDNFDVSFYNFDSRFFTMDLSSLNGVGVVNYNTSYIWAVNNGVITYTFNGEYFNYISITSTKNNYADSFTANEMRPLYRTQTPYESGGTIEYYIFINNGNDDISNFRNVVGNIFNSVQTLLDIQIGWFSIGGIIAIVLGVAVLFFVFKISRGGGNT